ncbi:MAG: MFS transporter [Acidimicrobiales bacterium]
MYRLVYLTYLVMVSSSGVTFVFLEDVESNYGIPAWGVGMISAITFVVGLFTAVVISPKGDQGSLLALGTAAFFMAIAGNATIGFATDLWAIVATRGLASAGAGIFAVAGRKALIGSTVEGSAQKLGVFVSAAVTGFIAGPALGAWLAEVGGIETPYILIAGLLAILAIPTIRWLASATIATSDVTSGSMLPLLRRAPIRAAVAGNAALFFNIGVFDSTVDEYLTDLGASNADVGLILMVVGAPLLILPSIAGRFVDRSERPAWVLVAALVVFVPILATISLWVSLAAFVVLGVVQTSMESFIFPSAARVAINETGASESALGQGLMEAIGHFAAAIAAFAGPVLYDLTDGPAGSFGTSATVAAVLAVFTARQVKQMHRTGPVAVALRPV